MVDQFQNHTPGLDSPAGRSVPGTDATFDPCRAVLANANGPVTGLLRDDTGAARTFELIKGQVYPLQFKELASGGTGVTLLY